MTFFHRKLRKIQKIHSIKFEFPPKNRDFQVPNDPEHNVTRVTYCHKHTHPQDVIIEDKYRTYRNPWLAKMETVFFLMTDYEMIAERCVKNF